MSRVEELTKLANETKKRQDDAKLFQENCDHTNVKYWIGVYVQAGTTLNWLAENGIYPDEQ